MRYAAVAVPVPLAFPFGLLVGIALAWAARQELTRLEVPLLLARPFVVAVGFSALVFAPVTGYFAMLHGDWAYLYVVPWARVPSAVDFALVLLAAAQVPLGFALAAPLVMAKRVVLLSRVTGGLILLMLIAATIAARRLSVSASYAQYHGGFGTVPLSQSSLGRGVLLAWLALASAFAWTVRVLRPSRAQGA